MASDDRWSCTSLIGDEGAASSPLGYIFNLALVTVLIGGLVVTAGQLYDSESASEAENSFEEMSPQITGTIQQVDRLVRQSAADGEIGDTVQLDTAVGKTSYVVEVINQSYAKNGTPADSDIEYAGQCSRACVVLAGTTGGALHVTNYVSVTTVESTRVEGGPLYVVRDEGATGIEITRETTINETAT
jgi:hypothetical protein